jgi:hypothetical protein
VGSPVHLRAVARDRVPGVVVGKNEQDVRPFQPGRPRDGRGERQQGRREKGRYRGAHGAIPPWESVGSGVAAGIVAPRVAPFKKRLRLRDRGAEASEAAWHEIRGREGGRWGSPVT